MPGTCPDAYNPGLSPIRKTVLKYLLTACCLFFVFAAHAETLSIADIQGTAAASEHIDRRVTTTGVVTLVMRDGFWIQDGIPTAGAAAARGLQVFTGDTPEVARGDRIVVTGTVAEYRPGDRAHDLTVTRLVEPADRRIETSGRSLPKAVRIGPEGRLPPKSLAPESPGGALAPSDHAVDFWEALEGTLVSVDGATVVGPTSRHGETWLVNDPDTPRTPEGGALLTPDDFNPRRILIAANPLFETAPSRPMDVGDRPARITGVVHYAYGNYRIIPLHALDFESGGRQPDKSALTAGPGHLLIAGYNVENLDPNIENLARVGGPGDVDDDIGSGRMTRIAGHIVHHLNAPDIVALQEIQDNDGAERTDTTEADITLKELIARIRAVGGPDYRFVERAPAADADGGQPGGNIRNAYLYRADRVGLVEGSVDRLDDGESFDEARKPLSARFRFNHHSIRLINVHLSSKWGSSPLFGTQQPIIDGGADGRRAQTDYLAGEVDAGSDTLILGDFNDFYFAPPLKRLAGAGLVNLHETLPANQRFTYIYQGNAQTLDHVVATPGLAGRAEFDIVHVNSLFARQAADHDPVLIRLHLPPAGEDREPEPGSP